MIGQSRDLVWFLCVCTTAFQTLTEIGSVYENEGKASRELCVCVCVCVCVDAPLCVWVLAFVCVPVVWGCAFAHLFVRDCQIDGGGIGY